MFDQLLNVPAEMQAYPHWVVWRYEQRGDGKPTKVPYDAKTGEKAAVDNPSTWSTFDTIGLALQSGQWNGAGFVFTKNDPFAGVDLDVAEGAAPSDVQQFIYGKLNSYAELSPSGRGVHIIVKGEVPKGRNSQELGVEVYSWGRFFTVTGNTVNPIAIQDRATSVRELWDEIGGVFTDETAGPLVIENPAVIADDALVARICASGKNNAYFNWTAAFDWSEAYRSVLGAACLFSSDEAQIARVILNSPLVTRAPAHGGETRPKRVARLWAKEYGYAARQGDVERGDSGYRIWASKFFPGGSRDQYNAVMTQTHENVQAMLAAHDARVKAAAVAAVQRATEARVGVTRGGGLPVQLPTAGLRTADQLDLTPPHGPFADLIGEICRRTRNPSPVMATWAALSFFSGVSGRSFVTEEGAGLNNFFILSAGSNTGKTQHWNALTSIVRQTAPKLLGNVFGGDASSPQIIAKEGQRIPSMLLRLPDAGAWLKGVVDAKTTIQQQIRSALLNIYEAAGAGCEWHTPKSIRAKEDKNETIDEFNMSIALDTTPQFITDFSLSDFTDGLMSRFILVAGPTAISPLQRPQNGQIPQSVGEVMGFLNHASESIVRPITVNSVYCPVSRIVVSFAPGMVDYLWQLDDEMNQFVGRVQLKQLPPHYIAASRVVLNAKRIAAVVAVLTCPHAPVVTKEIFDWSLRFSMSSVNTIIAMFDSGEMGSEESKQEAAILDWMLRCVQKHPETPYVTLSELGKYVDKLAPFANAKNGPRFARQKAIADLLERGDIVKSTVQTHTKPTTILSLA